METTLTPKEVKQNPEMYGYNSVRSFDIPLLLSNDKILEQNPYMDNDANFGKLSDDMFGIENGFSIRRIDINSLKIKEIMGDEVWVFEDSNSEYIINNISVMEKFSNYIGVPWKYTLKNPSYLTVENFRYHMDNLESSKSAINIVYKDNQIFTFMKSSREYKIDEIVPLYSKIVPSLMRQVADNIGCPVEDIKVQSYGSGFNGMNGGDHFIRLVLGDADKYGVVSETGEKYSIGINLISNFMDLKYKGGSKLSVVLFREICSNGMVVELDRSGLENLSDLYADREYNLIPDEKKPNKPGKVQEMIMNGLKYKFLKMVGGGGIRINNCDLNSGNFGIFMDVVGTYLNSLPYLSEEISSMTGTIPELKENQMEYFVNSCYSIGKNVGLTSPSLMKMFLVEFISSRISNDKKFENWMDITNFMTFIGRSYNASLQNDIESCAYKFSRSLRNSLTNGRGTNLSEYDKLKEYVLSTTQCSFN